MNLFRNVPGKWRRSEPLKMTGLEIGLNYVHADDVPRNEANVSAWKNETRCITDGCEVLLRYLELVERFEK
jgi:hypothetical protein